jgi:hypothetical protein
LKSFKKCGISNALDSTEDNVLFEESGCSDSDVSNGESDTSDDFRGFYDQQRIDTALLFG